MRNLKINFLPRHYLFLQVLGISKNLSPTQIIADLLEERFNQQPITTSHSPKEFKEWLEKYEA